jgi:antitoxin YefM
MMVMSETLPLAEVKAKLSEMVDRVEHTHDRITVTRNGRPAAVIISLDELASSRKLSNCSQTPTR